MQHRGRELVARRAVDGPRLRQRFAAREDLLDDDVAIGHAGARERRTQPLEIRARLEQPVDVVDSQAVDDAVAEQLEHELVHVLEHFRQLDPQAREVVDVEEPPIVDVVAGDAKVRGTPVLLGDDGIERAAHAVVVGAIDALDAQPRARRARQRRRARAAAS